MALILLLAWPKSFNALRRSLKLVSWGQFKPLDNGIAKNFLLKALGRCTLVKRNGRRQRVNTSLQMFGAQRHGDISEGLARLSHEMRGEIAACEVHPAKMPAPANSFVRIV
jgi:hypothetical protein